MKKVIAFVFFLSTLVTIAFAQRTSLNNYKGSWENAASWVGGIAPPVANPANITATHLDVTINGFITRTGNVNIAGATSAENFVINDTLVIIGDFVFPNDAAELVIGPNAVLIVIGNVSFGNNTRITNDGIFVVSGDASFANGNSEVYDDSGGGELFVQGNVTQNPDAQGADNWDNLDDLYRVIYDFVLCGGTSSCVLPIRLSYFHATLSGNVVDLRWATILEENFLKFVVQRSADGKTFEDIGEVAGKGFDIYDIESKYSFSDETPLLGKNYYRIKAVDIDDSFEHFVVRLVELKGPKELAVYPNPSGGDMISFTTNFNPSESDRVVLTNQLGVEIFSVRARVTQNSISFSDKLRPGIYMLRYVANDYEKTTRIVIKD